MGRRAINASPSGHFRGRSLRGRLVPGARLAARLSVTVSRDWGLSGAARRPEAGTAEQDGKCKAPAPAPEMAAGSVRVDNKIAINLYIGHSPHVR